MNKISTNTDIETKTSPIRMIFNRVKMNAALLVAFGHDWALEIKSYSIDGSLTIGRSPGCDLVIKESSVSSRHARIIVENERFFIEDLGSKNGTFVDGCLLQGKHPLSNPSSVIRITTTIFVFVRDASRMTNNPPAKNYGIAGKYYPGSIIKEIKEAAASRRHLLLAGPTGTGKELAARAYAAIVRKDIRCYNCARYASSDEAAVALFGVGQRVFSNVSQRKGLIESSDNGILFLDEIHNLPPLIQRSLLRIIEDGQLERIGESKVRHVDVQFVLASNAPPPDYDLASDLLARLRTIELMPLKDRAADVPAIFDHIFNEALVREKLENNNITRYIGADHYEAMCLDGFESNNVRGVVDLVDRLVTSIRFNHDPVEPINEIFHKRFADGPVSRSRNTIGRHAAPALSTTSSKTVAVGNTSAVANVETNRGALGLSHYEINKEQIIKTYVKSGGNLTITEALLKEEGISCSRRWLSIFLDKWGMKKTR